MTFGRKKVRRSKINNKPRRINNARAIIIDQKIVTIDQYGNWMPVSYLWDAGTVISGNVNAITDTGYSECLGIFQFFMLCLYVGEV